MITLHDLTGGKPFDELSLKIQHDLEDLLDRVGYLEDAYGEFIVTSGLRTLEHHLEIYAKKGITDTAKIPMKSLHLRGCAVDIADHDGKIKAWVKLNESILETVGLWCEDFSATPTWVHFQSLPPASGKRFFKP